MVKEMDENEKNVPEQKKSLSPDKNLKLDLSQAMTPDSDDDDDIIELKDEITLPPEKKEAEIDLDELSTAKSSDDEQTDETDLNIEVFDMETEEVENHLNQLDEFNFEEEDESPQDDIFEAEDSVNGEIPPPVDEKPAETGDADEVIEITEFDDILSDEANEMVTLTDEDEALDPEEEFLELIDIEEDELPEEADDTRAEIEDEIIQFDGPTPEVEDVELEDFINDSLSEDIRIEDDLEDRLTDTLGVDTGSEMRMAAERPEEDFDFNIESEEIAKRIDQVDTIFFDSKTSDTDLSDEPPTDDGLFETIEADSVDPEPEIEDEKEPLPDDDKPEEMTPATGLAQLTPEQIEESIDRVIQKKFSEKIESMVTAAIEKAVSKEIDRLKSILMDDDGNERL